MCGCVWLSCVERPVVVIVILIVGLHVVVVVVSDVLSIAKLLHRWSDGSV